jgi:hypothetical protein
MEREHRDILRRHQILLVDDMLINSSKLADFLTRQRVLE